MAINQLDLQNYIGYPIEVFEKILKENNVKYEIISNCSNKNNYDAILVVQVVNENNIVKIVTDKFLLKI